MTQAPLRQVETHKVTLRTVLRRASFVQGHRSFLQGKPLDYDAYPRDPNKQWAYERGRLFAAIFPEPIKNGKAVRTAALFAYSGALDRREIL
jgi:hypothetical protein